MDSQISWIFGHRGYLDIMDIWASWIFEHHIFGHHGYSNIIHILASRIKMHLRHCQCRDVFPNLTFKALALQVPGGHFLIFYPVPNWFSEKCPLIIATIALPRVEQLGQSQFWNPKKSEEERSSGQRVPSLARTRGRRRLIEIHNLAGRWAGAPALLTTCIFLQRASKGASELTMHG